MDPRTQPAPEVAVVRCHHAVVAPEKTSCHAPTQPRGRQGAPVRTFWTDLSERRPTVAQFIMFSLLSTGMTVLQLALMPLFKWVFTMTPSWTRPSRRSP